MAKKQAKPAKKAPRTSPSPRTPSPPKASSGQRTRMDRLVAGEKPATRTPAPNVTVDLGILGHLSGPPQAVSRELCQIAAEEGNKRKAEQLLKQAEALHPDSVLVPIYRGDQADGPEMAMRHYKKALARAEANWDESRRGKSRSRTNIAAHDLETAHRAMASALEALRRPTEAIPHYAAILELVPGDDTAIEALGLALLSAGRFADAAEVVARSDHPSFFTKALVEFCLRGSTPLAATFLKKGHSENPHVVLLLLGDEQFDDVLPEVLPMGSSAAAQLYLLRAMPLWRDTPGAITWLRQVLGKELTTRKPTLKERRHQAHGLLKEIEQVQELDTKPWRLSVRALHAEDRGRGAGGSGGGTGGQLAVLTNEPGDKLYHSTVFDDVPNTEMMLELLLDASEELKSRPSIVLFDDPRLLRRIETTLESSGIRARLVDRNRALDDSIDDLREQVVQSLDHGDPVSGEELERVPPSSDIWLVDSQRLPRWVENKENRFVRLQSVMVVSQSAGAIISQRVEAAEEDLPEVVWQTVSHAMTHPFVGPAQRPAEIRVRTHDLRVSLEARLRPLGTRCVVSDDFRMFDEAHAHLVKSLAEDSDDQDEYSLIKRGHSLESVEALYRAAFRFYRVAPWRSVPAEFGIEIEAKGWKKPRYATVIGQSGLLQGLCVYDSEEDFLRSMEVEAELDDVSAINLFFDEPQALPITDHDACLDHNWPVASPEGFPVVIRVRRRRKPGPPSPEELRILTTLVEILPDFIASRKGTAEVDSALGPLKLIAGKAKMARPAPRKAASPKKKPPKKK